MTGYIYITNHDCTKHNYGKTRQVRCIKIPEGKIKDGLSYMIGQVYTCQKQTPSSDDWLVILVSRQKYHDGFSFSYNYLMEHFELID